MATNGRMFDRDGPVLARAIVAALLGAAVVVGFGLLIGWAYAPAAGWFVAVAVFLVWTWLVIGRLTPEETAQHALSEDPTAFVTHVVAVLASLGSLAGVAYLLIAQSGKDATIAAGAGVASVTASWFLVHTAYTLRYARLYYVDDNGGVDFNQDEPPAYADFAYLAFTLGMTYQVSDTDLKTRVIRSTALRQSLLSYLLGAVVLAVTINLVVGLGGNRS